MRPVHLIVAASLACSAGLAVEPPQAQSAERIPGINSLPTIQTAAAHGQASVVEMFLKLHVDPNTMDPQGKRALNIACLRGDIAIVQLLLSHGANVNLRDGSGSVPLRDAALNGNRAVGELLLAQGAEIDAKDPETGATPLYEAVSFKRSDFAKLLIEKGASTSLKTKSGKTIPETAAANDLTEVVALIHKTGPHDQPERR